MHERIRWARLEAGHETAKAAAETLGVNEVTYRSWERARADNGREPSIPDLQRMGKKFDVSWPWLATGEGIPFVEQEIEVGLHSLLRQMPEDDQKVAKALLEALVNRKAG